METLYAIIKDGMILGPEEGDPKCIYDSKQDALFAFDNYNLEKKEGYSVRRIKCTISKKKKRVKCNVCNNYHSDGTYGNC